MRVSRRLNHESLEKRRLLAADMLGEECLLTEAPAVVSPAVQSLGVELLPGLIDTIRDDFGLFQHGQFGLVDGIQEVDNRLYVLSSGPNQTLFVFERDADGALAKLHEVEIDFEVREMVVHGDQVVVVGNSRSSDVIREQIVDKNLDGVVSPIDSLLGGKFEFGDLESLIADFDQVTDAFKGFHLPFLPPEPIITSPTAVALTISVGSDAEPVRQELESGSVVDVMHDDGNLVVVIHQFDGPRVMFDGVVARNATRIAGDLGYFSGNTVAHVSRIGEEGLGEIARLDVPQSGHTELFGDKLYVTSGNDLALPLPHPLLGIESGERSATTLSEYSIVDGELSLTNEFELGSGVVRDLILNETVDSNTATVVQLELGADGPTTVVNLIWLSGEQPGLTDTIRIEGFGGDVMASNQSELVMRNFRDQSITVVDIWQGPRIPEAPRVTTVDMPDGLRMHGGHLQINSDRLVIGARSSEGPSAAISELDSFLVVFSMGSREVLDAHNLGTLSSRSFAHSTLIDSEQERFGWFVSDRETGDRTLIHAKLLESGEVQQQGDIVAHRSWREIDATNSRLIARDRHRIIEYSWFTDIDPVVTPLSEFAPVKAIDDHFELPADGEDHLIDVLANDKFDYLIDPPTVAELAGAPEGTEILDNGLIKVPGSALEAGESLRFEYVITSGEAESSAAVEIDVKREVADDQVEALVDAVVAKAAEDLNVTVEEINVISVERFFDAPLPIVLPDGIEINKSPGILVVLEAPNDVKSLYAAGLDGEIIHVFTFGSDPDAPPVSPPVDPGDADAEALLDAVIIQAAEDLNVAIDEVEVISVERLFDEPIPVVLPDGSEINLSPGMLVIVSAPGDVKALYAAGLDGRIIQTFVFGEPPESPITTPGEPVPDPIESDLPVGITVSLGLQAVDDDGNVLTEVNDGDEFWLELVGRDRFGYGVFSGYFNLDVPPENLVITGPVEQGSGFNRMPGASFTDSSVSGVGGFGGFAHDGAPVQRIARIGVTAVGAGNITLEPFGSDALGREILVRGLDYEIPLEDVLFTSLNLTINSVEDPEVQNDANGDGKTTPGDALMLIDYLSENGSIRMGDVGASDAQGEFAAMTLEQFKQMDVNRDEKLSPSDALNIINYIDERSRVTQSLPRGEQVGDSDSVPVDEVDDFTTETKVASFAGSQTSDFLSSNVDVTDDDDSDDDDPVESLSASL